MSRRFTDRVDGEPGPGTTCWNCGAHVTGRFARVMGDNDDDVFGCPRCQGYRELTSGLGAAAPSDADEEDDGR